MPSIGWRDSLSLSPRLIIPINQNYSTVSRSWRRKLVIARGFEIKTNIERRKANSIDSRLAKPIFQSLNAHDFSFSTNFVSNPPTFGWQCWVSRGREWVVAKIPKFERNNCHVHSNAPFWWPSAPNKSDTLFDAGSTKPHKFSRQFVSHALTCIPKYRNFEVKVPTATSTTPCQEFWYELQTTISKAFVQHRVGCQQFFIPPTRPRRNQLERFMRIESKYGLTSSRMQQLLVRARQSVCSLQGWRDRPTDGRFSLLAIGYCKLRTNPAITSTCQMGFY